MSRLLFSIVLTFLVMGVQALPKIESCSAGARAGRPGFCIAGTQNPVVLRGSNYIRLGGPNLKGYHVRINFALVVDVPTAPLQS